MKSSLILQSLSTQWYLSISTTSEGSNAGFHTLHLLLVLNFPQSASLSLFKTCFLSISLLLLCLSPAGVDKGFFFPLSSLCLSTSISFHVNLLLMDFIIALLPDKISSFTTYNHMLYFSSPPFDNCPPPTLSHVSCLSDGFV